MVNERILKLKEQLKFVESMISQCQEEDDDFGLKAFTEEKVKLIAEISMLESIQMIN